MQSPGINLPEDPSSLGQRRTRWDAIQTALAVPMAESELWHGIKTFFGFAGPEVQQKSRRRLLYRLFFIAQATTQLVITVVFTTYGITTKTTDPGREGRSQFRACLDLSIMNLAWLARTALVIYLLVWGYRIRQVGRRQTIVETGRSVNPFHETSTDSADDPTLAPGEELYDVIPADSRRRYNFLTGVIEPLVTILLFFTMQITYILRRRRCGEVAPHIARLTGTLLLLFCITFARTLKAASSRNAKKTVIVRPERRGPLHLDGEDRIS
ncbi:hypothetical protein OH77DRAFT_1429587 [Trametes cingulata]|nr:hypothetical protein OH77DRAFT_1429587 [Trametes cingulata]